MAQTQDLIDPNSSEWLGTSRPNLPSSLTPLSGPFWGTKGLLSPGLCHSALNLCWLFLSGRANTSDLLLFIVIFLKFKQSWFKAQFSDAACRENWKKMDALFVDLWFFLVWPLIVSVSSALLSSLAGITYTRWTRTLPTVTRSFSIRWVWCLSDPGYLCFCVFTC